MQASEQSIELAGREAKLYAKACTGVIAAVNVCGQAATQAANANEMAAVRPQHEISIRHFVTLAATKEQEFGAARRALVDACERAKTAAHGYISALPSTADPELLLMVAVDDPSYGDISTAIHVLSTDVGRTSAAYLEDLARINAAIQADDVPYGEAGYQPRVHRGGGPAGTSVTCPWCAQPASAAGFLCPSCGQDVRL